MGSQVSGKPLYGWIDDLGVSVGLSQGVRLPTPLFNMINGGLHGAGHLEFQEFWVIPAIHKSFKEGLQIGVEVYQMIGKNLAKRGAIHSVGHEGGYAPNLFTNADAFEVFIESIKQTEFALGRDLFLGLDVAANSFYKDGEYNRAYSSVAPTVFENAIDTFTEKDVEFWKGKAETRFKNYTPGNGTVNTENGVATENKVVGVPMERTTKPATSTEDLPF